MRVLVGCEFSGVVREAFCALGHDAMSCDLLPTEIPGKHYNGDIPDDAEVACHLCGASVEPDALTVQTMADGTPLNPAGWMCAACLVAGAERLAAAIERERRRARREGGA